MMVMASMAFGFLGMTVMASMAFGGHGGLRPRLGGMVGFGLGFGSKP